MDVKDLKTEGYKLAETYKDDINDKYFLKKHIVIFLTLPVTVALSKWSFTKLKIVKNYLNKNYSLNITRQDWLLDVCIISVEYTKASSVCYSDIIKIITAKSRHHWTFEIFVIHSIS